jgi:hypothetical protein
MAWQLYWYTPISPEALATMLNVRVGIALNALIGGFLLATSVNGAGMS